MHKQIIRGDPGIAVVMVVLSLAAFALAGWIAVSFIRRPFPDSGTIVGVALLEVFLCVCGAVNLFLLTTRVELSDDRITRLSVFGRPFLRYNIGHHQILQKHSVPRG
jgi:hypothetical protein